MVNSVIEMALAGKTAGVIFEGDKKFDICGESTKMISRKTLTR